MGYSFNYQLVFSPSFMKLKRLNEMREKRFLITCIFTKIANIVLRFNLWNKFQLARKFKYKCILCIDNRYLKCQMSKICL